MEDPKRRLVKIDQLVRTQSFNNHSPCFWRPSAPPFFPLSSCTHLRRFRMSRAHIFPNAHDTAVSGGTFYAADTVSGTVRYLLDKLMAWNLDLWQIHININNDNRKTYDGVIPLMPNSSNRFTGRTEVIAKLKRHFSNADDLARKRKFFLLYGMGGIGKTQICLKFVEEMSD